MLSKEKIKQFNTETKSLTRRDIANAFGKTISAIKHNPEVTIRLITTDSLEELMAVIGSCVLTELFDKEK